MFGRVWIVFLLQLNHLSLADHYKGGTISWKPTNPFSLINPIEITITERHSWTLFRYPCNESIINTLGTYNDTLTATPPTLTCISSSTACISSQYQTISSPLYCTDFSTVFQISSGTYYTKQNLLSNSVIDISWRGAAWATETLANAWSVVARIDLTPISGKINTSPVTGSLPIFQLYVNELAVLQILAYDWDSDQIVRCRWSNQLPSDECGNVCFDLANAVLNPIDCSLTWTPVLRAADIANGLTNSTYVVAITAEDFTNASSTTALSSIPHQILIYVSPRSVGICPTRPSISGFPRRNLACYAVSVGSTNIFRFQSRAYCLNDSIVEFISSSPLFAQQTNVYQVTNNTWGMNMTWIPNSDQTGLQPFCIAAVDNNGQTSNQYCVMIVVGGINPNLPAPTFVQSTASPLGTVMATQIRFSIQATLPLKRTMLNGTFINIYRLGSSLVRQIDCKYSPDIYFINNTLVFFVTNPSWVLGATYYVTMTDGVATADSYCGTESTGFGGSGTWRFTIWDPSMSSTITPSTTTTTATTHTVTTRDMGTTTGNTLYTTTGIPAYTRTTITTTTSTTSTSSASTTTTSATTTTTTTSTSTKSIPSVDIIYPKDMERACLQPITIGTVLITLAMIPLHLYGMTTIFVKMNRHYQNKRLRVRNERRKRLRTPVDLEEEEEETFV